MNQYFDVKTMLNSQNTLFLCTFVRLADSMSIKSMFIVIKNKFLKQPIV